MLTMDQDQPAPVILSTAEAYTYRARLRFRIAKRLDVADATFAFDVAGKDAMLQAQADATPIQDSDWLIVNARGFTDEASARSFGQRLQSSLHLAAAVTRLGMDPGRDLATSGLAQQVRDHIAQQTGALVRDNVHGLD